MRGEREQRDVVERTKQEDTAAASELLVAPRKQTRKFQVLIGAF